MSPDYILSTLNGVMAPQAENLNEEEKIKLSEYITGGKISQNLPEPNFCTQKTDPIVLEKDNSYLQWGYDKKNTRNALSEITSENVQTLKLKWVFAYPSATRARSQPSLSGNAVFVGGQNLFLYALDKETGCVRWRTKTDGEIRSAPAVYFGESGEFIFVGDYEGNLYKINLGTFNLKFIECCGSNPICPKTGILFFVRYLIILTIFFPPSNLTASHFVIFIIFFVFLYATNLFG